jgi:ribosomal protein L13E
MDKMADSDQIKRQLQQRGIVSWKQTEDEARELGIGYDALRREAGNASQFAAKIEAVKQLRANTFAELHEFLKTIPKVPTEQQKKEIMKKIDQALFIDRNLRSMGTEHGRAVNILRKEVFPEEFEQYNEVIDQILSVAPDMKDKVAYLKKVNNKIEGSPAFNRIINILGTPRSMMATADLSAPLRQGLFLLFRQTL